MMDSFYKALRERVSSPLYGTLTISWLIFNWRIVYVTLFISEETIAPITKIDYITNNYWHYLPGIVYPIISAAILLTFVQWLDKEVFKLHQEFKTEKRKIRELHEKDRMLTKEESVGYIKERLDQEERHQKVIAQKDKEISILNSDNTGLSEALERERTDFKLCYAEWGMPEDMKDVTDDIRKELVKNPTTTFEIGNSAFTVADPAVNQIKHFTMVYFLRGEFKTVRMREYDFLTISPKEIEVDEKPGAARRIAHEESIRKQG